MIYLLMESYFSILTNNCSRCLFLIPFDTRYCLFLFINGIVCSTGNNLHYLLNKPPQFICWHYTSYGKNAWNVISFKISFILQLIWNKSMDQSYWRHHDTDKTVLPSPSSISNGQRSIRSARCQLEIPLSAASPAPTSRPRPPPAKAPAHRWTGAPSCPKPEVWVSSCSMLQAPVGMCQMTVFKGCTSSFQQTLKAEFREPAHLTLPWPPGIHLLSERVKHPFFLLLLNVPQVCTGGENCRDGRKLTTAVWVCFVRRNVCGLSARPLRNDS